MFHFRIEEKLQSSFTFLDLIIKKYIIIYCTLSIIKQVAIAANGVN